MISETTSMEPFPVTRPRNRSVMVDGGQQDVSVARTHTKLHNLPATILYEISDHLVAAELKSKSPRYEGDSSPSNFGVDVRRDAFPSHTPTSSLHWPITTSNSLIYLASTCQYLRYVLRRRALVQAGIREPADCDCELEPTQEAELRRAAAAKPSISRFEAHSNATPILALTIKDSGLGSPLCGWIPILKLLPALRFLRISQWAYEKKAGHCDDFFGQLSHLLPQLRVLNLLNRSGDCDEGLVPILKLPNLESLSLIGFTWNGFDEICIDLPKLKSLRLWNCHGMLAIPGNLFQGLLTLDLRTYGAFSFNYSPRYLSRALESATSSGPVMLQNIFLDLGLFRSHVNEVNKLLASEHVTALGIGVLWEDLVPEVLGSWGQTWCNLTDLRIRGSDAWKATLGAGGLGGSPFVGSYDEWHQAFSKFANLHTLVYSFGDMPDDDIVDCTSQVNHAWVWEMAAITACPTLERLERRGMRGCGDWDAPGLDATFQ